MITVWGGQTSRSLRVVWVLEEMGLPYRVRQVNMLAAEQDSEFLSVSPADYIPAIQDGDVAMVESIAIMEYLMARYGPTPIAPAPSDSNFAAYQQFLHLGEAGLATLMMPIVVSRIIAPETESDNWGANWCLQSVQKRLGLVSQQLSRSLYLAGDTFTAADISVTYALSLGQRNCGIILGDAEQAYLERTMARDAYKRAMERSHEGVIG